MNAFARIIFAGLAVALVGCSKSEAPPPATQAAMDDLSALMNDAKEKGFVVFVGIDPAPHQGAKRVGNKGLITTNFANGVRNNYRMTTLGRLVPISGGDYDPKKDLVGVWERTEAGEFNGIMYGHASQGSGEPRGFILKEKPANAETFTRIMIAQGCPNSGDEDVLVSFADFPASSSYEQCKTLKPYGYLPQ